MPTPEHPLTWVHGLLDDQEVEVLAAHAFGAPELDDAAGGRATAAMYGYFSSRPGAAGVSARSDDGQLVGFAYGYPNFRWSDHVSSWDQLLRTALGGEDPCLVGAWTVMLLAVDPRHQHHGAGRELLRRVVPAGQAAWLGTRDAQTPAQRLYASEGWIELGRGPLAGSGETSVVLFKPVSSEPTHPTT